MFLWLNVFLCSAFYQIISPKVTFYNFEKFIWCAISRIEYMHHSNYFSILILIRFCNNPTLTHIYLFKASLFISLIMLIQLLYHVH